MVNQQTNSKHILVVEDDPDYAFLVKEHLKEKLDFPVLIRSKGNDILPEDIDNALIIIADFKLPDISGLDLIKTIRKKSDIPIIVLTGQTDLEIVRNTLKDGANDFLEKSPTTLSLLPENIRKNLKEYEIRQKAHQTELLKERQSAQIETLRQILTTLAHYINNSTTTIFGYAQLSQKNLTDANTVQKLIDVSIKETRRITYVLQELENLVNKFELQTKNYLNVPNAMFDIERNINEKMRKFISQYTRERATKTKET